MNQFNILLIGGPTGSGKSELACALASRIGAEIVSVDSMAVYKYMDIGTAKQKDCRVKQHLVDILKPGEYFDAKLFENLALRAIEDVKDRGKVPILCGGTYLYFQVLLYGLANTPEPDWNLRKRLYSVAERKGSAYLYQKLKAVDPTYAKKVHPEDTRRIVRALEVFLQTGKPFSFFHRWQNPRFSFVGFYIKRSWESLSRRIEQRVKRMIEGGLLEEVKKLLEMGFENFLTSQQAIGYKELVPYLRGEIKLEDAVERIIKNTKEYAKRQIRWFRKQGWVEVDMDRMSLEEGVDFVLKVYNRYLRDEKN
ncbi:tRNA (adenosine(37)-N6)-dimethylallyltransferase MiaA [Thermocrinis sp.]|uniref:tRNA (adenosine(37)-N6)-dimethylallyltransferase MiaA n=1 Tax=Thermocrinis sp. TaxID=2024383 RepID=UPI002FDE8DEC